MVSASFSVLPATSSSVPTAIRTGNPTISRDPGAAVPALLNTTGAFDRVEDHADLTGRPRFATGYRLPS